MGDAHAEIKALKYSERLKEKAVEEVLLLILALRVFLFQHLLQLVSYIKKHFTLRVDGNNNLASL